MGLTAMRNKSLLSSKKSRFVNRRSLNRSSTSLSSRKALDRRFSLSAVIARRTWFRTSTSGGGSTARGGDALRPDHPISMAFIWCAKPTSDGSMGSDGSEGCSESILKDPLLGGPSNSLMNAALTAPEERSYPSNRSRRCRAPYRRAPQPLRPRGCSHVLGAAGRRDHRILS